MTNPFFHFMEVYAVKTLSKILLVAMLFLAPVMSKAKALHSDPNYVALGKELTQETKKYYQEQGAKRNIDWLNAYFQSSVRVSKIFKNFPAKDNIDRILKFYSYRGSESRFRLNYAVANIPGAKYSNGKVKRFSVDFGSAGLNQDNVTWTYEMAFAIQNDLPLPETNISKRLARELRKLKIPKNLKLKQIDLSVVSKAKKEYLYYVKKGVNLNKISNRIKIEYKEETSDELDSILIYRILVELDRIDRGWEYETWDHELYDRLVERTRSYAFSK